jgi:hypothetical protein
LKRGGKEVASMEKHFVQKRLDRIRRRRRLSLIALALMATSEKGKNAIKQVLELAASASVGEDALSPVTDGVSLNSVRQLKFPREGSLRRE